MILKLTTPIVRTTVFAVVAAVLLGLTALMPPAGALADGGSITTRSHNCPLTYAGASASMYDLAANCPDLASYIPLNISQDGLVIDQSSTNGDGTIHYVGFSGGQITIDQIAPASSFARAFCAVYADAGEGGRSYVEYSNPITQQLQAGDNFDCEIYNVAYPSQTPAEPTGTVYVVKHNCPVGFDVFATDIYGLAASCHGGVNGVTFTLSDATDPALTAVTVNGMASWSQVPVSDITITETVPAHYLPRRIFCNFRNADGSETGFNEYTLVANYVRLTPTPGSDTFCDWFDLKLGPGQVVTGVGDFAGATPIAEQAAATPVADNATAGQTASTSVTVHLFHCDSTSVALSQCAPDTNRSAFTLAPIGDQGEPITLTADENGVATGQVKPGSYAIAASGKPFCFIDSDSFDAGGALVVADRPVSVSAYGCGD